MRRTLRIHFKDGTHKDCDIVGLSMLPDTFSKSFSLQERKGGTGFQVCIGGGLIPNLTEVANLEIIRE